MKWTVASAPLLLCGLVFAFAWHISVGAKTIPLETVFGALMSFDGDEFDHVIIVGLRLPRAIYAAMIGASLSVAGALMQGVTRNPLAEPGILGILAGASFAVVIFVGYFGAVPPVYIPLVAAGGALVSAALVWGLSSAAPGGATPLTLVLSGAAITAFLGAFVTLANLLDGETFRNLRIWMTGALGGRDLDFLAWVAPWIFVGLIVAFGIARQVTALSMGEDTATGLGVNVARVKGLALGAAVALSAASVAIAGPMGFVGLVIPHVARILVGSDYRLIVPYSAGIGALYLLIIDIAARLVLAPVEIATGIVTAIVGAPFFVWLVRARL